MYENDGTYAGVLFKSYALKWIKSIEYDPSNHGQLNGNGWKDETWRKTLWDAGVTAIICQVPHRMSQQNSWKAHVAGCFAKISKHIKINSCDNSKTLMLKQGFDGSTKLRGKHVRSDSWGPLGRCKLGARQTSARNRFRAARQQRHFLWQRHGVQGMKNISNII